MFNNSISIPVTEDQPEEFSGKIRSRSRRKRRKSEYRGRSETCKQLTRYWPLLVLIASVFLLIFEVYRIDWKSSPKKDDVAVGDRKPDVKKPDDNLNRLDAPRCLKLLPHEELQHLDFPLTEESFVPIKNLVYMSESNEQHDTNSQNEMGTTRFNSFTGYQTLDQRAQSFKVNETVRVHCGFYSENGSFTISNGDKNYMLTCQSVVSTCAFGGGDNLYQPIGMSDASLEKVCYVAFWDEITLATQEKEGHIINKDHFIGKWRIIIVGSLLFRDQRLNGKIPKPAKIYKLKRLAKVEVLTNDTSGCTFMLGFDNIRNQRVAPIQWTMRNLDDRLLISPGIVFWSVFFTLARMHWAIYQKLWVSTLWS